MSQLTLNHCKSNTLWYGSYAIRLTKQACFVPLWHTIHAYIYIYLNTQYAHKLATNVYTHIYTKLRTQACEPILYDMGLCYTAQGTSLCLDAVAYHAYTHRYPTYIHIYTINHAHKLANRYSVIWVLCYTAHDTSLCHDAVAYHAYTHRYSNTVYVHMLQPINTLIHITIKLLQYEKTMRHFTPTYPNN